jgi:uncharacterized protein (DUF1330 family)
MAGYLVNRFDITDREQFIRYTVAVTPIIADHGGEILFANDAPKGLEGPEPGMSVVIAFPSEEAAMGFYDSPEYQPVKELRLMSTTNWNAIVSAGGISVAA